MQHAIRTLPPGQPSDLLLLAVVLIAIRVLIRSATKWIGKMGPAGTARLRLAWLVAAMPRIAFLVLTPEMIHTFDPRAMRSGACMAHCYSLICILAVAIGIATVQTWRRSRTAAQLMKIARHPSARLARFAGDLGIAAVELPTDSPICAMAGILKPRVLLSRGALARLSDEELHAALAHERVHLRRRETFREGVAAFLNRCTILPVPAALKLYRSTREFAADSEAAREVPPLTLASVLLAFARFELGQPAVQLAEKTNLRDRVSLLLDRTGSNSPETGTCLVAFSLIAVTVVVSLIPASVHAVQRISCMRHG
jgi:Zn-dependent protease with chaperone function